MLSLLEGFIILSDAIICHMALTIKKILIKENTFHIVTLALLHPIETHHISITLNNKIHMLHIVTP